MLQLYWKRGVLPRTLLIFSALGDLDGIRACLEKGETPDAVEAAFLCACRFKHEAVASVLLDGCIEHDAELGERIDAWRDRASFIAYLGEHSWAPGSAEKPLWQVFATCRLFELLRTDEDLSSFARFVQREPWLLDDEHVPIQVALLENFSFKNRGAFIRELFASNPAILRRRPPPEAAAIRMAIDYGHADVVPLLTRIWPLPDDLPHAAGMGDFANVKKWFDQSGRSVLGDPSNHHPGNDPATRAKLHWGPANAQQVLDFAFVWAVMNRHFDIATFLLEHGADINTDWCTHEPASILHDLVFMGDYEQMQFVIDHGIDMTIRDYRYNATAQGWALVAKQDEKLARFLGDAELEQKKKKKKKKRS
jgi:ankyrin repeat protein